MAYKGQDGSRNPEYLAIDPTKYRGTSQITPGELEIVLSTISSSFADFKKLLAEKRPADWRFTWGSRVGVPLLRAGKLSFTGTTPLMVVKSGRPSLPRDKTTVVGIERMR